MTLVAVAAAVVAVLASIALVRTWLRANDVEEQLHTAMNERDVLASETVAARGQAHAAKRERDDVHDRLQRAEDDAAEAADRLRDESTRREEAEAAVEASAARLAEVEGELEVLRGQGGPGPEMQEELEAAVARLAEAEGELEAVRTRLGEESSALREAEAAAEASAARLAEVERELDSAREGARAEAAVAGSTADDIAFEVMWALALARIERLWRTSISLGLDESPLTASQDQLRTAVEVMIDAAREEAGADIELHWSGEAGAPARAAVIALEVIESAVAAVSKSAWTTEVYVSVTDTDVVVQFDSLDDAGDFFVVTVPPALAEGPNHIRIPISGEAAVRAVQPEGSTGAPPGR